ARAAQGNTRKASIGKDFRIMEGSGYGTHSPRETLTEGKRGLAGQPPAYRQRHAGRRRLRPRRTSRPDARLGVASSRAITRWLDQRRETTMLTRRWDKTRMPSRHVTVGPGRAPHRSYYYAMGLTEDEIDQPFVGVATCWNEAAPCNIALARQAQSVKKGVNETGGTPREFTTITVTDGIAMGHQGMK